MGVVIESDVWEPNKTLYLFLLVSCFLSIFCLPHRSVNSNRVLTPFEHSLPSSLLRFQRNFLLLYSISSVMEGLWSVFGEYELAYYGVDKEQMVLSLCIGYAAALFLGTFLGMLSDLIGQKKVCLIFCILHLFVSMWKRIFAHPSVWLASICLSLAASIFSFSFETWMVVTHDKLGHRQDTLDDKFWLMTFTESASFIGSQVISNWLVLGNTETSIISPPTAAVLLAILSIILVAREWKEVPQTAASKDYRIYFTAYIFGDKRVWLLAWAQACIQFSIAVFWILWASTIVADGREVQLGLIYPCFLGARMLGSTTFPWFFSGPLYLRTEDCLVYVFIVMGFILSIVAYDYQEIGVLVTLFCLFHVCVGLVLPSLARLRTMYVPNELRGGMISLSLAPANAAILFLLLQRGYYQCIENSTIMAFAALGLFSASGCLYLLKRWGKQPYQNWHKL
ncbi:Molybdate-anion transporter like [Actinidia chinensis var. chinensis]|uniref:Molybdate-anion transporter like n=1 Tax=Actinidia chinensis var. chinensis TaxID=1590841 RepID=A0A2R6RL43_ACTCC|nr:Molybdate-anion transporter like [Actinidia chinensis var. chinensis]